MSEIPENTQIGADGVRYPTGTDAPLPFVSAGVSLGTTATVIHTATARADLGHGETVTVQNLHASAVVTVGSDVIGLSANGVVLAAQWDSVTVPLKEAGVPVYAISDTVSTPISVTKA